MNKKKILLVTIICISAIAITAGIVWGFRIYQREKDPYWQAAKEIYNVQTALQAVDEDWKLESLSKVDPFTYQSSDGTTIRYYCCTTTYLNEEPTQLTGFNKTALDQVVDIDVLENRRDCDVNGQPAVMGELDGLTYLCWTVSPQHSCVLEYTAGTVAEEDIFRMAESVAAENTDEKTDENVKKCNCI